MKEKLLKLVGSYGAAVASLAAPFLAMAQFQPPNPGQFQTIGGFQQFICNIIVVWLFTFLIILAVIFIIFAAFKYLTASGDPEKVKSASHTLIYAVVAVVIAILARAVPSIISTLFGGTTFVC